nr:MAG TPA: hypothetical protein [Caudoviricetes sp.]DAM37450.1 MAG TPA: hypothetical protein [Caudoviricetes sp.]
MDRFRESQIWKSEQDRERSFYFTENRRRISN